MGNQSQREGAKDLNGTWNNYHVLWDTTCKEFLICWRKFRNYAFIKTGNILPICVKFRKKI